MSTDGRRRAGADRLRRAKPPPGRAHDGVHVPPADEGDDQPTAVGRGDGRRGAGLAEAGVDALGRLPDAVDQARDEDVRRRRRPA